MLMATHQKQQKSKKVILLNNTFTFGNVLLANITFLIFGVLDVQLTMSPLTFIKTAVFYIYFNNDDIKICKHAVH